MEIEVQKVQGTEEDLNTSFLPWRKIYEYISSALKKSCRMKLVPMLNNPSWKTTCLFTTKLNKNCHLEANDHILLTYKWNLYGYKKITHRYSSFSTLHEGKCAPISVKYHIFSSIYTFLISHIVVFLFQFNESCYPLNNDWWNRQFNIPRELHVIVRWVCS